MGSCRAGRTKVRVAIATRERRGTKTGTGNTRAVFAPDEASALAYQLGETI
jgi:hypothetical protein